MIETTQLSEEEIEVVTESGRGKYRYIFEYTVFSWILREKYINGEEVEVTDDTSISSAVRDAVKTEAHDEDGGILDNMDIVSTRQGTLTMKHEDTFAKWGEDLTRDFIDDEERIQEYIDDSIFNQLEKCFFCQNEKYCRHVGTEDTNYFVCTDCEDKNPDGIRINVNELTVQ